MGKIKECPKPNVFVGWDRFLASPVGEPKCLHLDTAKCKRFDESKVFVEVVLSKELPKSFQFKSEKGVDAIVEYEYPWLPPRCGTCFKWGHLLEDCIANKGSKQVYVIKKKTIKTTEQNKQKEKQGE